MIFLFFWNANILMKCGAFFSRESFFGTWNEIHWFVDLIGRLHCLFWLVYGIRHENCALGKWWYIMVLNSFKWFYLVELKSRINIIDDFSYFWLRWIEIFNWLMRVEFCFSVGQQKLVMMPVWRSAVINSMRHHWMIWAFD